MKNLKSWRNRRSGSSYDDVDSVPQTFESTSLQVNIGSYFFSPDGSFARSSLGFVSSGLPPVPLLNGASHFLIQFLFPPLCFLGTPIVYLRFDAAIWLESTFDQHLDFNTVLDLVATSSCATCGPGADMTSWGNSEGDFLIRLWNPGAKNL